MSVVVSVIFGFFLLLAVTFAIPDTQGVIDAGGYAVTYIWETSIGTTWAKILLFIVVHRADVLPDRVGDLGVADDVRVLARPRGARATSSGGGSRRSACRRTPCCAIGMLVVGADGADAEERRRRLPRRHLDRGDRPLHRVRHPRLPALAGRATSSSAAPGTSARSTSGSIRSRSAGSRSSASCSCSRSPRRACRGTTRSTGTSSTTRRSPSAGRSCSSAAGTSSRPRSGSRARSGRAPRRSSSGSRRATSRRRVPQPNPAA